MSIAEEVDAGISMVIVLSIVWAAIVLDGMSISMLMSILGNVVMKLSRWDQVVDSWRFLGRIKLS